MLCFQAFIFSFQALFPYTVLGLIFALAGCKALTILSLGDETARGLGVSVEKVRFSMTAVAALLAAGAVSIADPGITYL